MERVQVPIGPAALQPHLAAPPLPSLVKRRTDDGTAMATPLASRMRHDVLDHCVRTAAPRKRFGEVISMQVEMILASSSETKTTKKRPSRLLRKRRAAQGR
jgi:hypothetical protein